MNKKVVSFIFLIILLLGTLIFISLSQFSEKYKSADIKIVSVDEYGDAQADDGTIFAFKGRFVCDDETKYNNYELANLLEGKSIRVEYRITDEGDNKIEKFWLDNVFCSKNGGGNKE